MERRGKEEISDTEKSKELRAILRAVYLSPSIFIYLSSSDPKKQSLATHSLENFGQDVTVGPERQLTMAIPLQGPASTLPNSSCRRTETSFSQKGRAGLPYERAGIHRRNMREKIEESCSSASQRVEDYVQTLDQTQNITLKGKYKIKTVDIKAKVEED